MNKVFIGITFLILFGCNQTTDEKKINDYKNDKQKLLKENKNQIIADTISFNTYCNKEFEYCIDYPEGILIPEPESQNGDGRGFINSKGRETLIVYGFLDTDWKSPTQRSLTLEEKFNEDINQLNDDYGNYDSLVTYKKLGDSYFVLTGYKESQIYYRKTIVLEDAFATAILYYDVEERILYDKIAERIFESFRY